MTPKDLRQALPLFEAFAERLTPSLVDDQRTASFDDGRVSEHYDVIIVGSGAGGDALAHMLGREGRMLLGGMS